MGFVRGKLGLPSTMFGLIPTKIGKRSTKPRLGSTNAGPLLGCAPSKKRAAFNLSWAVMGCFRQSLALEVCGGVCAHADVTGGAPCQRRGLPKAPARHGTRRSLRLSLMRCEVSPAKRSVCGCQSDLDWSRPTSGNVRPNLRWVREDTQGGFSST